MPAPFQERPREESSERSDLKHLHLPEQVNILAQDGQYTGMNLGLGRGQSVTTTVKPSRIVWVCITVLFFAGLHMGYAASGNETPQADTQPSPLAQYYGFGPMEILKLQWNLGAPVIADINGDGLKDLIFTNNRKARIDLLLQKKDFAPDEDLPVEILDEDVNDILGREKFWRFKRVSYDLDVEAKSLILADWNNDGLTDMAFYASDGLRIVLQDKPTPPTSPAETVDGANSDPQAPQWMPAKKVDIREGLSTEQALAAGDLNGDMRTDLALLAGDGTFLLMQKDNGSLAQPEKYHCGGQKPRQLHIADVNGDKRADLIILTGEQPFPLRVRYQTDAGRLGPEVRYELPAPRTLEVAGLDHSHGSCFLSVSRHSGRIRISAVAANPGQTDYPVFTYPLPATDAADKRDITAADVDGDGLMDVVVSDPSRAEFLLFRAAAATGLATPKRFPGLTDMRKLAAGDLDGSGQDAIAALSLEEKTIAISRLDKGRLRFPESIAISDQPQAMDLADVNGDALVDLVYIARQKKEDKYFLRTVLSVGHEDVQTGPELELTELKDKPLDVRVGDIDHDGRMDVMIVRPYGPLLLVRQPETGQFAQVTKPDIHSGLVANVQPASLSLAPLGSMGTTAALLAKKNFARAVVFDPAKGWQVVDQYQVDNRQSNLSGAAACRLPDQEALAIVTYDTAREKLGILTSQADGTYRTEREIEVGFLAIKKILTGDFGGMSPVSILLCGARKLILVPASAQKYLLRKVASFETDAKGVQYGAIAIGDINGDTIAEILAVDQARHHVEILAFDAAGQIVSASKFKVFEEPRSVERGNNRRNGEPRAVRIDDVTGDGKNDLILFVHDRIIIYPQD